MPNARISVKNVYLPDGKGPTRVQTITGEYFKVWRELGGVFVPGGTFDITYDTEVYNGKEQHTVRKAAAVEGAAPVPVPKTYRASTAPEEKNEIATLAIFKAFRGEVPEIEQGVAALNRAAAIWHQFKQGAGAQSHRVQSGGPRQFAGQDFADALNDDLPEDLK